MPMSDIVDLEEAFTKTGAELFKELFRIYPVAEPEDYFKNGQWKNDVMKCDLMLIESHRRESGAPDVADLEDIKMPTLPTSGFAGYFQPQTTQTAAAAPAGTVGPKAAGTATIPLLTGGAVGTSTPVVEIRLIALFVAKWKLDPVTAKTALAKLTPARRRYVIQNFKATSTGVEATKELEKYIATCEEDGSWDTAPAATTNGTVGPAVSGLAAEKPPTAAGAAGIAAAKAVVAPRPLGAVVAPNPLLKRPLVAANPAWQQNKRPAISGLAVAPGVVRPSGAVVRPPAWGKATGKGW